MAGNISLDALDKPNLSLKDMNLRDRGVVLSLLKVFTVKMALTKSEPTLKERLGSRSLNQIAYAVQGQRTDTMFVCCANSPINFDKEKGVKTHEVVLKF